MNEGLKKSPSELSLDNVQRGSFKRKGSEIFRKSLSTAELGKSVMGLQADIKASIAHRLENAPRLWNANKNFLELYQPYIKTEWRFHYFAYDTMKAKYKALKEAGPRPNLVAFERYFYSEIQHVDWFLSSNLHDIERDLQTVNDSCDFLNNEEQDDPKRKEEMGRTVEIFIRSIFEKCKQCERFYKLNHYVICKIAKKFEKLIESGAKGNRDFTPWKDYPSNMLFNKTFASRLDEINYLTAKSVTTYSDKFRKTYPSLAYGELEFVKNKERESSRTRFYIGVKLGLAIAAVAWIITSSYDSDSHARFWTQPGLFVYTTVGNLLLFRICWCLCIYIWSQFDVNYISIFNLSNSKPNLTMVMNQTASQFILYFANIMVFFRVNSGSAAADTAAGRFLSYGCPSLLIVVFLAYELYMYLRFRGESLSRGLFTKEVLYDCVMAPFAKVTFRDNYAADCLTSFTKVISDLLYASCWIVSGSFLRPNQLVSTFGSDYMTCHGPHMAMAIALFQIYPQYIRIAQCGRNFYKTGLPLHLVNICKYLSTVAVIAYGITHTTYDNTYIFLAVLSAVFKWWWDVVMDWGLFEIWPTWRGGWRQFFCCRSFQTGGQEYMLGPVNMGGGPNASGSVPSTSKNTGSATGSVTGDAGGQRDEALFLRESLLYPSYMIYYIAIVMDLILRCVWVFSLLPPTFFGDFVGPKLNFFLASIEILRRSMWGIFRLEWEHLKFVKKGTPGYLEMRQKDTKRNRVGVLGSAEDFDDENQTYKEFMVKLKPPEKQGSLKDLSAKELSRIEEEKSGEADSRSFTGSHSHRSGAGGGKSPKYAGTYAESPKGGDVELFAAGGGGGGGLNDSPLSANGSGSTAEEDLDIPPIKQTAQSPSRRRLATPTRLVLERPTEDELVDVDE